MATVSNVLRITSLRYTDESKNKNKYYIVTVEEENGSYKAVFKYGRMGNKNPRILPKPCTTLRQAENYYFDKVAEQKAEGYEDYPLELIMQSDGSFEW